ncbi:hypothetical protein OSB04_010553 [Centaurea solstitialis]|uniref:Uncharacterized protein n=1 Tax=Centaurea solstitialis TaxID=347529 RepID=A0AA38T9I2_9ASTR|nr:hypothetical protein OSB04_010553 [Centaurea solstitialis]
MTCRHIAKSMTSHATRQSSEVGKMRYTVDGKTWKYFDERVPGWSGQGYKTCPVCNDDTPSTRVIGKTAYVGHGIFLPSNHLWRKNKKFDGKVEKR